ncbi:hypothetical protein MESS4_p20092 [Mesorhizobium sp. STM 4661]|nr:hypothetical protein MESS4_p20092 [Mesorhizobium sp. STM 4661]
MLELNRPLHDILDGLAPLVNNSVKPVTQALQETLPLPEQLFALAKVIVMRGPAGAWTHAPRSL